MHFYEKDCKLKMLAEQESLLCNQLMEMFRECEAVPLNLGCVGNSIASGYSKCDEMIPLFARTKLYQSKENVSFYSFARVRRNEELNVLNWYNQNISHPTINALLLDDLRAKKGRYACYSNKQEQEYKKIMSLTELGFQDCIKQKNNVLIYCGLSGTFTDILRKGNFKDRMQIIKSFRKDYEYLKMFLTQIYMANPLLQVYACGLPDVFGIGLTNRFDKYIRKAVHIVPNAVYVSGVAKNIFDIKKNQKEIDYHYSKEEYLCLICNIWHAILRNYIPMQFKNEVLMQLAQYSSEVELNDTTSKGDAKTQKETIVRCEKKYQKWFEKYSFDIAQAKKKIWDYYDKNFLVRFGCTDREVIRHTLLEVK